MFFVIYSFIRACWEFVFGDKKDAFLAQRINSQHALNKKLKTNDCLS